MSQFLDAGILFSEVYRETGRRVEGLIAAKSWRRKLIGTLAKYMSASECQVYKVNRSLATD